MSCQDVPRDPFFQYPAVVAHLESGIAPDVAKVPRFGGNAGNVFAAFRVAHDKAVLPAVLGEPGYLF